MCQTHRIFSNRSGLHSVSISQLRMKSTPSPCWSTVIPPPPSIHLAHLGAPFRYDHSNNNDGDVERKYNDSGQNFDQNCVCFATTFLHELWQNTSLLCHSERANRGKKYETRLLEKSENFILVHSWTTSRWPPGKWLPRPQKWMKKNSDESHISSDMLFHRFGGFHDLSDPSSLWKFNSPKFFHAQGGRHSWLWFSQSSRLDYLFWNLSHWNPTWKCNVKLPIHSICMHHTYIASVTRPECQRDKGSSQVAQRVHSGSVGCGVWW